MGRRRSGLLDSTSSADREVESSGVDGQSSALFRHWWVWPLAAYLLLRLADAIMIVLASQHAGPALNRWTDTPLDHTFDGGTAPPGYLKTATNWDGQWYWQIADRGYPARLPRDTSRVVHQSPWAFFPGYPMTVRLIMAATGLGFPLAAVLVSLVGGAVATILVYRLVAPVTDRLGGRLLVIILNTFVCAPVFQIAYTEGMAFALLAGILLALNSRRFTLTAVLILALSLTRAVVLPLAAVIAIVSVRRWRRGASAKEVVQSSALAVWALVTSFLWPAIAALVTGEPKAYLLTQQSWNSHVATLPVLRFIDRLTQTGLGPWMGSAVALVAIVGVVLVMIAGQRQQLLRLWTGVYSLYLLAALDWNSTIIRYFMLAVPAVWGPTHPETGWPTRHRVWIAAGVAVVGLAMQWWWIRYSLTISPQFYQVP